MVDGRCTVDGGGDDASDGERTRCCDTGGYDAPDSGRTRYCDPERDNAPNGGRTRCCDPGGMTLRTVDGRGTVAGGGG